VLFCIPQESILESNTRNHDAICRFLFLYLRKSPLNFVNHPALDTGPENFEVSFNTARCNIFQKFGSYLWKN